MVQDQNITLTKYDPQNKCFIRTLHFYNDNMSYSHHALFFLACPFFIRYGTREILVNYKIKDFVLEEIQSIPQALYKMSH